MRGATPAKTAQAGERGPRLAKRADMVEARREKRRKQIFDGAVKVYSGKGHHAATMQEIADAAGIAKGSTNT